MSPDLRWSYRTIGEYSGEARPGYLRTSYLVLLPLHRGIVGSGDHSFVCLVSSSLLHSRVLTSFSSKVIFSQPIDHGPAVSPSRQEYASLQLGGLLAPCRARHESNSAYFLRSDAALVRNSILLSVLSLHSRRTSKGM